MIQIDLITGFLGSGKTTFLRHYAAELLRRGQKIGILENDYGAVNVDMMLLQDLEGEGCGLESVAGACDLHCHRRRFKTKLIALGMSGYDRVLIEPSGIFDVDEFFDALYEPPLDNWYAVGNVICVVDANLEDTLSDNSEYLLASQLANAGAVVLSKTQEATAEELAATVAHLNRAMERVQCRRRFTAQEVFTRPWDALTQQDYDRLLACGCRSESFVKLLTTHDDLYQSQYFLNLPFSAQTLRERAQALFADKSCGEVFRVKGFAREADGWTELNVTRKSCRSSPCAAGQSIVIVIGEELNKERIASYFT